MEHRWGRRVTADIDVQIFADPASVAWGRLRDISVSGGFIETALKIRALSTLSLTLPTGRHKGRCVARDIVIRSSRDGVGVEWFDADYPAIAAVMQDIAPWRALTHAAQLEGSHQEEYAA